MKSLFAQFKRNRDSAPDATAFLIAAGDRSVPIPWRQFVDDVEVVAHLIRVYAPGARIGILGENSYEWMVVHAAAIFSGAVAVPIEVSLSPVEIVERMAFVGAGVLVHSALYQEKAQECAARLPGLLVAGFGSRASDRFVSKARAELAAAAPRLFDLPPRDENEVATIVFTSGTTSTPRGVQLTLAAMRTFCAFAAPRLAMENGDRSLMLLPLHHIYGICSTYLMLTQGVALGVCPDFRRIFDAVLRFRADFLCLVPALAELFAQKLARRGASVEDVLGAPMKWVLSGGAVLPRRVHDHLAELGVTVLQIYGLTETAATYAMSPYDDPRPGSVGRSCQGESGMETRVSSGGELLIRGPAVMCGYFGDPERTANAFDPDGWYRTGDLGRIDDDGYVWITGRLSRTIVLSSGKKVAPEEMEQRILALPGVREVVVSGDAESRDLKAEIYAVVGEDTVRRQMDVLNRQLPVYKRIRLIQMRREPFPRTSSGKIRVGGETQPGALTPPVPYQPLPRRPLAGKRWPHNFPKRVVSLLAACLVMVVATNLPPVLAHFGIQTPPMLRMLLESCEEWTELALGLMGLVAIFLLHRNIRKGAGGNG